MKDKDICSYKVVTEGSPHEVWAIGFYEPQKAQERIDQGYFHRYVYPEDKNKKLIVVPETRSKK